MAIRTKVSDRYKNRYDYWKKTEFQKDNGKKYSIL